MTGTAAKTGAAPGPDWDSGAPLLNGLRSRCPRCGRGHLFVGFLTVVERCPVCGLGFQGHDAGDGPAVAGIFILGFGIVGFAWLVEALAAPPLWVHAALWIPGTVVGTVALLRPLKGITIAAQFKVRAVDEPEQPGGS